MVSQKTLLGALPIVARALGRNYGINVVVGGTGARTDGKTIQLPALPVESHKAAVLAYGYLDHEAGHVRCTDFQAKMEIGKDHVRRAIYQILEDVRMEKQMNILYPGTKKNLARLVDVLVEDGDMAAAPHGAHPLVHLQAYMLHRLRNDVLGQHALRDLADKSEAAFNAVVPAGAVTKITALMYQVTELQDTMGSVKLSKRIIETIREEAEKAEEENRRNRQQGQDQAQGQGQGQAGQGGNDAGSQDGKGNQSGNGQDAAQGKGESNGHQPGAAYQGENGTADNSQGKPQDNGAGQPGEGSKQDSPGQGSGAGDGGAGALKAILNAPSDAVMRDMGDIVAQKLDATSYAAAQHGEITVQMAEEDQAPMPMDASQLVQETEIHYKALRVKLRNLVEASRLDRSRLARAGSRIDSRKLCRLATGRTNVFRRQHEKKDVNTAVQLVLDRSGSMGDGGKWPVAIQSTLALARALESIKGLTVGTCAFPGSNDRRVVPLTKLSEKVAATAGRYAAVYPSGGTPMAQAVWWAADALVQRQEPRKMLLVVTDGQPGAVNGRAVKKLMELATRQGIECIGVGIKEEGVKNLFPEFIVVQDVNELPNAVFGLLRHKLVA